jgi:hypothetical protein
MLTPCAMHNKAGKQRKQMAPLNKSKKGVLTCKLFQRIN